jgi:hypothetical protein
MIVAAAGQGRAVRAERHRFDRAGMAGEDGTDFAAALPVLTRPQRRWLSDALSLVYGPAHPWRARLCPYHEFA